jgi:galactonate dehydratase
LTGVIGNTGGIVETKKITATAETYNMRIQPHNCSSPVCTAASLQLDATIANYIEELYSVSQGGTLCDCGSCAKLDFKDSYMPIPNRPGLGVELVEERVRPFLWGTV